MKLFAILFMLLSLPVLAGERHETPPPAPVTPSTPNVPDDGSNRNAFLMGVVIFAGICIYHKCWKEKPVQDSNPNKVAPEVPANEFLRITPK